MFGFFRLLSSRSGSRDRYEPAGQRFTPGLESLDGRVVPSAMMGWNGTGAAVVFQSVGEIMTGGVMGVVNTGAPASGADGFISLDIKHQGEELPQMRTGSNIGDFVPDRTTGEEIPSPFLPPNEVG